MTELVTHIRKFVSLTDAEALIVNDHLSIKQLKKKDHILKEGQVCHADHFVLKGCLRMYFVSEDGSEHITQFGIDNWWITDHMSLTTGSPSRFGIQAIEDSSIAVLNADKQKELFKQLPQLEQYRFIVLQKAFAATQMRLHYIFDQSGEERYHHFVSLFPGFVQRIPQYMLASYLGFTPEFLSKIRGKKVKGS